MASFSKPGLLLLLALLLCSRTALAVLVPASPLLLAYHKGSILAGPNPIKLSLTFYGQFDPSMRAALKAFLSSLSPSAVPSHLRSLRASLLPVVETPSVSSWWSLTQHYSDLQGHHVSQTVSVEKEMDDPYSLGRRLTASDMARLAKRSANVERANSLSVIFTSADVLVEGFCMHACGGHSYTSLVDEGDAEGAEGGSGHGAGSADGGHGVVPYVWVGNPELQCPGFCAWPFAKPQFGPDMAPWKAPNGVGVDGMIITLAKLLVGAATNPLRDAFYQGDDGAVVAEAGGVCAGRFGEGAYPGFPGEVLRSGRTGASYNMEGSHGAQFLVPWIWNPATETCAGQA